MNMRYHHLGVPTTLPRVGEQYHAGGKCWISGYETSPYGIEWMRFDSDSTVPDLVKSVPHLAFEVDDLAGAIAGKHVIIQPNSPSAGVMVAFIVDNGMPIEFLQIKK